MMTQKEHVDADDIQTFMEVCERALWAGGAVLRERLGKAAVSEKGTADLVTEADYRSQAAVFATLHSAFPDHDVVGEESASGVDAGEYAGDRPLGKETGSEFRWIVDPLDGTTNFVHQVPFFSVALALERHGKLLVSGVYDPMADECFLAGRGRGAFLNGKPIHTSGVTSLRNALAALGLPAVAYPDSPDLKIFCVAASRCQALRRTGSAALNLAYTAAGRFDVSWAMSTKIWDIAAGVLLIQEAGGVVTGPDGETIDIAQGGYLAAANPELMGHLQQLVRDALAC